MKNLIKKFFGWLGVTLVVAIILAFTLLPAYVLAHFVFKYW